MKMRKITALLITVLIFVSCGDEVEFNSPALQGYKNYELWRADYYGASIGDNGYLTISGGNNSETLELTIPSVAVGTYIVGDVHSMQATFIDADGIEYSTRYFADETVSIYPEYGIIKLEEIDFTNLNFTGTFRFNAFSSDGLKVVNFSGTFTDDPVTGGVFNKIPLTSGSIPDVIYTCTDAEDDRYAAQLAYFATFAPTVQYINADDFMTTCSAYSNALHIKRVYCGDIGDALLDSINNLGDCAFPCTYAVNNRNTAQAAFEASTIGNYITACNTYALYLQEQIDFCGDDGTIQADLDALDCNDDDNDGVPNYFEDFNGDGDLTNDDTDGDTIPNYLDDDDDGDGILTQNEEKDIDGNPIDTDGDGNVNYLDPDDDGDSILTSFESGDTDTDGIPNYLDNDDDEDGLLTINENPDPNMDGDPADALDTDVDGIPDYLDNM